MSLTLFDPAVFALFVNPGEVVEIRALGVNARSSAWRNTWTANVSGYFDDHKAFCDAVATLEKMRPAGIYFTLQVIDPRLIGRSFNRLTAAKLTTSDTDVLAFRWLPIDLDPIRPAGISSSDSELETAFKLRDEIAQPIADKYQLPRPIRANSGNGAHLLYRLPCLRAKQYVGAVKEMLHDIAEEYSTDQVNIDETVFNPARIWKLYGTTSRKGDEVPAGPNRPARPHRLAVIDIIPEAADDHF